MSEAIDGRCKFFDDFVKRSYEAWRATPRNGTQRPLAAVLALGGLEQGASFNALLADSDEA